VTRRRQVLIKDDLGDAVAVAQVKKDKVAMVAATVDPAHEGNGLARIARAEFATGVCTLSGA